MSRPIMFSRVFPSYHPKKGEPTLFVEKIWKSLAGTNCEWDLQNFMVVTKLLELQLPIMHHAPKHHTIRAGHRWKIGDNFSPRVWSGIPYRSKQIIIAPDIEIKKIWDIKIVGFNIYINKVQLIGHSTHEPYVELANNDGLLINDFWDWFDQKYAEPFDGQIICWNESVNY